LQASILSFVKASRTLTSVILRPAFNLLSFYSAFAQVKLIS